MFVDVQLGGALQLSLHVPSNGSCESEITISSFSSVVNRCFEGTDGEIPLCEITEIDITGCGFDSVDFLLCEDPSESNSRKCSKDGQLEESETVCG